MKALVFHGPNTIAWEEVPDARLLEPTDAVVQVDTTTICGTDLHILHGDVPAVTDGRVLGHEGVGTVVAVGRRRAQPRCWRARDHLLHQRLRRVHATAGARTPRTVWRLKDPRHRLGARPPHRRDAGRAGPGAVRGQLAAPPAGDRARRAGCAALRHPADGVRDRCAVRARPARGHRRRGRSGTGRAWPRSRPRGSTEPRRSSRSTRTSHRLDVAKRLGATVTVDAVGTRLEGAGAGRDRTRPGSTSPSSASASRRRSPCAPSWSGPAGTSRTSGCTAGPVELALQDLWIQNITITTGLVNTTTLPMLLRLVAAGKLPVEALLVAADPLTYRPSRSQLSGSIGSVKGENMPHEPRSDLRGCPVPRAFLVRVNLSTRASLPCGRSPKRSPYHFFPSKSALVDGGAGSELDDDGRGARRGIRQGVGCRSSASTASWMPSPTCSSRARPFRRDAGCPSVAWRGAGRSGRTSGEC